MFAFIDCQLRDYEVTVTTFEGPAYICDNRKEQDESHYVLSDLAMAEIRWERMHPEKNEKYYFAKDGEYYFGKADLRWRQ